MTEGSGLKGMLATSRKTMLAAGGVATAITLLTAGVVLVIGRMLSGTSPRGLVVAGALVLVRAALAGLQPGLRARVFAGVRAIAQEFVYRHVVTVGPAIFDTRRPGELVSLAVDAVGRVAALAATFIPLAIRAAVVPVSIAVTAIFIDLPSGLAMLLLFPVVPLALRGLEKGFRRAGDTLRSSQDRLAAEFLEAIQGLETLLVFGAADRWADHLTRRAEEVRSDTMDVLRVAQRGLIGVDLVYSLVSVVGLGALVAWRASAGAVEGPEAVTLVLLSIVSVSVLVDVVSFFYVGGLGLAAVRRLRELFAISPDAVPVGWEEPGESPSRPDPPGIRLEAVSFRYPDGDRAALHEVSFSVPAGASLALVGRSGAGKSTLTALLLGTRTPDRGRILLAGDDVATLDRGRLATMVGYVGQDTYVFAETVEANLLMARPDATLPEIEDACRRAHILDVIEALPEGFQTQLGEGGSDLSGGEAQRLGIARAFLADTPVLVMDEATSGLDMETEALIHDSLEQLMQGRTTIVIAHRITTARRCDLVVQLDGGRVVAEGTPATLEDGFFARMGGTGR
ncbi:MAG TPA: ABC transporter ATP-binding protein [Acidimicrobiia bacterium]|nr:ABC transporter ATP-binding protein [Acidimicrobiia bacterium]